MILPRGNPLIEDIKLGYTDINIMVGNLEHEGFSGYLMLDYTDGAGIFFFLHGGLINTLDLKLADEETYQACLASKFFSRIRKKETKVSGYVLTPNVASVLSNIYLFRPIYKNYKIHKKELMLLLSEIEEKSYTGFLGGLYVDGVAYILFDKGKFVVDNFALEVGQILCSSEKIHGFLDYISNNGADMHFYAEEQSVLEAKRKSIQEKLNRIKQLIIKGEARFLGKGDCAKIDEYIVREWGIKTPLFTVELETNEGKIYKMDASSGRKLGGYVSFASSFIKKAGLKEGDLVSISPME